MKNTSNKSEMFSREEFEEFLSNTEHNWQRKDYDWTKEWVYEAKAPKDRFTIVIYSSIDKKSNETRKKDSDAMRLVVLDTQTRRPILKEKSTYRIKTWRKNLRQKIENVKNRKDEVRICSSCGGVLVIRENSSGDKFYGCSTYPDCKNTENIE